MARRAQALMREAFEKWDADGNGTISTEELTSVLKQLGTFKGGDIKRIMIEADKNGDGMIDYSEFVSWLMRPVVTIGAAALYSTAQLCLRAEAATIGKPITEEGEIRWDFAGGPVQLSTAQSLPKEHTIAMWVCLDEVTSGWSQLCGDTKDGWGLTFGISDAGLLGMQDPRRAGEGEYEGATARHCAKEPIDVAPGSWALVVIRGICETAGPSQTGNTEFIIASDQRCARFLGSVDAVAAGLVIDELGSRKPGVTAASSLAVWSRLMADSEVRELFLWDAVRFGCVSEEEAEWLRKNRRKAPERTPEEEETFTTRLKEATAGRAPVLDVSDLKVVDSDLPKILHAVEMAYDGVSALVLSKNYLTEDGMIQHLAPFLTTQLIGNFRIDLRENPDINCDASSALTSAMESLPVAWGVSIDARGTGLRSEALLKLLNQSEMAQSAARAADTERKRTATLCTDFEAKQADIQARWADEVDSAAAGSAAPGGEGDGGPAALELEAGAPFGKFPDGDKEKLKTHRAYLRQCAVKLYDKSGSQRMTWGGDLPAKCGSGQLIAHFAYLSKATELRDFKDFNMELWSPGVCEAPTGSTSLHKAVSEGLVTIKAASGKSFGRDALTLKLENTSKDKLSVFLQAGTIFGHISWIHHQNLMVGRSMHLALAPGEVRDSKLGAYCMNMSCACSEGDPMHLTALLITDKAILTSQGKVWDHFEGLFAKFREEAGYPDNAKGKKKKGGKKKGKK